MAISDSQKVDLLIKKLYGVAKTDIAAIKSPSNESVASPLMIRGDLVWANSNDIPTFPPLTNTTVVQTRIGSNAVACTVDLTSTANRTWHTGLTDWIPIEFGPGYQVRVWTDTSGAANPTTTGTQLFPDGSGNNDGWYFDYQAGVLNFADTNLPSSVSSRTVYVEGYRYVGTKGLSQALQQGFVSQGTDPSNWDTNYTFGLYYVNRVSWSATVGTPTSAATEGLLSVLVAEGMVVQKYQPNDTLTIMGSEWVRVKAPGGGWSDWTKIINDNGQVDGGNF